MSQPTSHSPVEVAESFVREWTAADAPLDFSPASLEIVGQLVAKFLDMADDASDASPGGADEMVRASCYMGEVVRRSLGGDWEPAGGGADMLRGVAGRAGDTGRVIPLSDLILVISSPMPSLTAWYERIASDANL